MSAQGWLRICVAAALSGSPAAFAADLLFAREDLAGKTPVAITGNPAVADAKPGTGFAGRLLHLPEKSGLRIGGVWLADTNGLLSGGAQPGKWSWNSALIVGANLNAETLVGWKGASFGIQFLQFNGGPTNRQAGSVQGYNSLPEAPPLARSELFELWYRQALFEDRLVVRIGKQVPNMDFNNVSRPVATDDEALAIPAVTGLLYTPVFTQPTLLGTIGGYYNSVSGVCVSLAPTRNTYLRYGFYDGNLARGVQTGMTGPHFNGYYFNIWEAGMDWVIADKYPGNFGAGLWYQTGVLHGPNGITENGAGGFYLFGSQRVWSNEEDPLPADGGKTSEGKTTAGKNRLSIRQRSSISTFFQFGTNNSETRIMNQSFGLGVTGFGLVPQRPRDSLGAGMSWAWLNPNIFDRSSELMFQGYYQAHIAGSTFFSPAMTYIPTPGGGSNLGGAWAATFRLTVLF
ncbi:MAG TPA: carbohydrate porin [Terrimicrobiaceae bacterium]|nr:carbohydrate porin [Terrimicrobiaceae bacterium]